MSILLERLIVTQNGLRNISQLGAMTSYISAGGKFTHESLLTFAHCKNLSVAPLIHIARVDYKYYIHDGHHRILALFRAGRNYLKSDEYEVADYTHSEYAELGLARGWYTPFDLINECRLPNFKDYKTHIRELVNSGLGDHAAAYSVAAASLYKEPRRVVLIDEFNAEQSL